MNITLQKKRTTRNIKPSYEINRKTIDTQHIEHVKKFRTNRTTLALVEKELEECQSEIDNIMECDQVDHDRLVGIKDRMIELRQRRRSLQESDSMDYFVNTANILFKYYDIVDNNNNSSENAPPPPPPSKKDDPEAKGSILKYFSNSASSVKKEAVVSTTTSAFSSQPRPKPEEVDNMQRGHLLEKYMEYTNVNYVKTTILGDIVLVCPHCQSSNNTIIQSDGIMVCNMCNTVEYVIIDHDKPSYKDPPKEISYYAYKRLNHFNEWLNQVQGKETTDIPEEIFDNIMLEIKKQKVKNMATLTQANVKSILKKLKLTKYFEHVPYITCRINGQTMPQLSPELEDKLRNMFRQIQAPFVKHSPPERKNFLSYSYVIHKFLQLLGHDEYLHCFPLLRDKSKNYASEVLFKKICEELYWEFIKSI
jgi:hypothetical protein